MKNLKDICSIIGSFWQTITNPDADAKAQVDLMDHLIENGIGRVVNGEFITIVTKEELLKTREQICSGALTVKRPRNQENPVTK